MERSLMERSLAERSLVDMSLVERSLVERSLAERSLVKGRGEEKIRCGLYCWRNKMLEGFHTSPLSRPVFHPPVCRMLKEKEALPSVWLDGGGQKEDT